MKSKNPKQAKASCLENALRLVARKEHSFRELRFKLQKRHYEDDDIDASLEHLQQLGLLNEQRFTELFVYQRLSNGYGQKKIRYELEYHHGIATSTADACFASLREDQWQDFLYQAVSRKYHIHLSQTPIKVIHKWLLTRGFEGECLEAFLQKLNEDL